MVPYDQQEYPKTCQPCRVFSITVVYSVLIC